jgi:hypothetical protein
VIDDLVRLDGARQIALGRSLPGTPLWATWGLQATTDLHSWPCFVPGGGSWAAFRVARDGGSARVVVGGTDGVERESVALDAIPVYLQWSPRGQRLAVLVQRGDQFELRVGNSAGEDLQVWLSGTPLFFAWLGDDQLVAHVGRTAGRNEVVVADGVSVRAFPGMPASFCTPVPTPSGIVWAALHGGHAGILVTAPVGVPSRELEVVDGLAALIPTSDGRVLRAVSTDGNGRTYRDLRSLDPRTGRSARVSDTDLVAFLPIPGSVSTLVARPNPRRGSIVFSKVREQGRDEELVADVIPSRDLRFWLRFFEQFAPSHPLVDARGESLVVSGTMAGGPTSKPHVWQFPLSGGPAVDLGEGPFACFAPPPPREPVPLGPEE